MKGQVVVRLKPEVLDPQGATVAQALASLGYDGIGSVRQGKVFDVEIEVDDPCEALAALKQMGTELLANPVIETFEVRVDGAEGQ